MPKPPNGLILYEGPSRLTGAPIVVIATGLHDRSRNEKTGAMIQTYIICPDIHPLEALRTGADAAICGDCPHRPQADGKRSCYVQVGKGPAAVWNAYRRGRYPVATAADDFEPFAGRMIRLGTYGDPAAAPYALWQSILQHAAGWTGYTHQWRYIHSDWSKLVMASADSVADFIAARELGYRTFRVTANPGETLGRMEIICPASAEAGKRTTCEACRACMGTSGKARASIAIAAHGNGASNFRKLALTANAA